MSELMNDTISRQQAITALRALSDEDGYINVPHEVVTDVVRGLPPVRAEHEQTTQSEQGDSDKFGVKTSETCEDCISRQAAISAICNACGKIDCDKMDKCEKLQLPPANCSEFPNNSDTISRQAAIDAFDEYFERIGKLKRRGLNKGEKAISLDTVGAIKSLPPAQPERIRGRWIAKEKKNLFRCSKCDAVIYSESEYDRNEFHKFCGRCGAEMRGELK